MCQNWSSGFSICVNLNFFCGLLMAFLGTLDVFLVIYTFFSFFRHVCTFHVPISEPKYLIFSKYIKIMNITFLSKKLSGKVIESTKTQWEIIFSAQILYRETRKWPFYIGFSGQLLYACIYVYLRGNKNLKSVSVGPGSR